VEAYWSRIESYSRLRESYVSLLSFTSFLSVSLRFTSFLHVSVSFLLSFLSSFLHVSPMFLLRFTSFLLVSLRFTSFLPVSPTIEQRKRPSLNERSVEPPVAP
jgi:hypothetical protein